MTPIQTRLLQLTGLLLSITLLAFASLGCDPPTECLGDDPSFSKCIGPTIVANCTGSYCHSGSDDTLVGANGGKFRLAYDPGHEKYDGTYNYTYNAIRNRQAVTPDGKGGTKTWRFIVPNDPENSLFFLMLVQNSPPYSKKMPHNLRAPLSITQRKMFRAWIEKGAINDDPAFCPELCEKDDDCGKCPNQRNICKKSSGATQGECVAPGICPNTCKVDADCAPCVEGKTTCNDGLCQSPIPAEIKDDVTSLSGKTISFKNDLLPIIERSCRLQNDGCHVGDEFDNSDLDFRKELPSSINGKASVANPGYEIVSPSQPMRSLLLVKLLSDTARPDTAGARMPLASALPAADIAKFYVWIRDGAKNN